MTLPLQLSIFTSALLPFPAAGGVGTQVTGNFLHEPAIVTNPINVARGGRGNMLQQVLQGILREDSVQLIQVVAQRGVRRQGGKDGRQIWRRWRLSRSQ